MKLTKDNVNSKIFLDYIKSYGFDPNNYRNILELVQSAPKSMSQFLKDYKQFLLSNRVKYDEIDNLEIDGAYGYFFKNGILIPKTIVNDFRFYTNNSKLYEYPNTNDFDVFISNGTCPTLFNTAKFQQDKFLGFCVDSYDDNIEYELNNLKMLLDTLNSEGNDTYTMSHDTISTQDKELYLVKKR